MGLDVSHDAFHGAYSAFNRLRQMICRAVGGSFPPHSDKELLAKLEVETPLHDHWYVPDDITPESSPGLYAFLEHSDCDGDIDPATCDLVANELELLLPKIAEMDDGDQTGGTSFAREGGRIVVSHHPGHFARLGGYTGATKKFIEGCRLAASSGEKLEFH